MYCQKCGEQNDDNAYKCVRCGEVLPRFEQPSVRPGVRSVPNYLVYAILATLFCCVPFGIAAIVYAAQVNGKLAAGDYAGALESSRKAKKWCWVAFGVGVTIAVLYIILVVAAGLTETTT